MSDYVLDGDHDVHEDEFGDENGKEDVSVTDEMHFDAELEAIKERFKEIEADANKLHDLRRVIDKSPISSKFLAICMLLILSREKTPVLSSESYHRLVCVQVLLSNSVFTSIVTKLLVVELLFGGACCLTIFSASESNNSNLSDEDKTEVDLRSVYVGNVDYGSTADELEAHFRGCGPINRVTILCNKFTGHPKGFAYIEFDTRDAVEAAIALDDSSFRSRQLKVLPKRTNVPGMSMTNRPPFVRGRARGRGMSIGFRPAYAGRMRFPRYRRRGSYYFTPY
ncbi:unnamed protein product [Schistosoma mattheei]|uniref:RRM domain-containing protein n=1 Tax=Schistosoma mattheei TaxID=31246 RepID=A0AA85BGA9_9TREM|nr:unnamed protein product [Schistosoma mattheei]